MSAPKTKEQLQSGQLNDDLFQRMILQSPVAIGLLSGPSLVVEVANKRMLALLGKKPEQVFHKPIFLHLPEALQQELEKLGGEVYHSGEEKATREQRLTTQNEKGEIETRYVDLICSAIKDEGSHVRGIMMVAIDVTMQVSARRKLEENEGRLLKRLNQGTADLKELKVLIDSILKNSPVGITVYKAIRDGDGKPVDFRCIITNEASAKLTGIPVSVRYTKTVRETIPGFHETETFKMAVATLENGTSFRTEYYYEQEKKWLELAVIKIYEDHLINVFKDITEIKEAQFQLEAHINKLERMNADLSHFTYAASHDMKEPLRKVLIFCDRLGESLGSKLSHEQQHYLGRIEFAAKRMNSLIDDLLTYHEVGGKPVAKEWVNLNALVREVLADLELEVEEKKANIFISTLFSLYGHPRQLRQAFHNLIGNALKYSKPGVPPEIKIHYKRSDEDDAPRLLSDQQQAYVVLVISDNGMGFELEDADRIFNIFERLHSKTHQGTGLGLPIVQKVVENHQGLITAEGAPGIGATFKLFFPANATRTERNVIPETM